MYKNKILTNDPTFRSEISSETDTETGLRSYFTFNIIKIGFKNNI